MKNKISRVIIATDLYDKPVVRFERLNGVSRRAYALRGYGQYLLEEMIEDGKLVIEFYHFGSTYPYVHTFTVRSKPESEEFFSVMSVSREDLDLLGFDTSAVSDETMNRLAARMGDSLNSDSGAFYYAVEYHGEMLDIPRPNPKSYDDEDEDEEKF